MALRDNTSSASNNFSVFHFDIDSSVSASYNHFSRSSNQQRTSMVLHDNPFTVSDSCDFSLSAMYGPHHSSNSATGYPKRITDLFLTPGSPSRFDLFNFMTNEDDLVSFRYMIVESDAADLQKLASSLTSYSDDFLTIIRNKFGSTRVRELLGKSEYMDKLFCEAIRERFLQIMTADKYASYVALRAIAVFDKKKKTTMYESILFHALDIARDKYGCVALKDIITDMDDEYYRDGILEFVAHNALTLSNDESGNYVVQHVLELNNLVYTIKIANNLKGHYVELSFNKYGSFVVEKLLEADGKNMVVFVALELLECNEDTLIRLARNEYGNYVVRKTLNIARGHYIYNYLFVKLVSKLRPFIRQLRGSHGRDIANILDSVNQDRVVIDYKSRF